MGKPLGMESGKISDASITASSNTDNIAMRYFAPHTGRVNNKTYGWVPEDADKNPWFQVDLGKPTKVKMLQPKSLHRDQQITSFVWSLGFSEPSISFGAELMSIQPITERVHVSSTPNNDGRIQNLTDV